MGMKWGKSTENQLSAYWVEERDSFTKVEPEIRFCGIRLRKKRTVTCTYYIPKRIDHSTANGEVIADEQPATRTYRFCCGLLKVIAESEHLGFILDEFCNFALYIGMTHIKFDPELTDSPCLEFEFTVHGATRHPEGDFTFSPIRATMLFRDKSQMDEYFGT